MIDQLKGERNGFIVTDLLARVVRVEPLVPARNNNNPFLPMVIKDHTGEMRCVLFSPSVDGGQLLDKIVRISAREAKNKPGQLVGAKVYHRQGRRGLEIQVSVDQDCFAIHDKQKPSGNGHAAPAGSYGSPPASSPASESIPHRAVIDLERQYIPALKLAAFELAPYLPPGAEGLARVLNSIGMGLVRGELTYTPKPEHSTLPVPEHGTGTGAFRPPAETGSGSSGGVALVDDDDIPF
jgi:hypothetical protein